MAGRSELLDHLVDQLTPLGEARGRPMFGGYGVYLDGLIIGLIAFDSFYLKADDENRPDFEAAGSAPFSYDTKCGTNTITAYWEVPADVLEDSDALRAWALKSLAVSRRAGAKSSSKRKKESPPRRRGRRQGKGGAA
ncbi:MAG: TfoX/Sxy family protein [Rhodospirillales bacterium]|nr:TfoX/Sxy family protein [Rhodospirillales bacterium]